MKLCLSCQEFKEKANFAVNTSKKDGLQAECKDCNKIYRKIWYEKNRKKRISQIREREKKIYKEVTDYIISHLENNPCSCGQTNILTLQFDHDDREMKEFTIALALKSGKSVQKMKEEISKCTVRCASCHQKKTQQEQNTYRWKYLQSKLR